MSNVIDSYLIQGIIFIINSLWEDSIGRIFLITFIAYFTGYSIYGGYLSQFTGGVGAFSISKLGFQISDLITLLPTAVITATKVAIQTLKSVVKWVAFLFVSGVVIIILGISLGILLRYLNIYANAITAQIGTIIFLIGFSASGIISHPFGEQKKLFIALSLIQIVGIAISYSGAENLSTLTQQFWIVGGVDLAKITEIILREIIALMILIIVLTLPILFGIRMGEFALEGKVLSRIRSITTQYPLPQLDFCKSSEQIMLPNISQIFSMILPRNLSSIPISIEPDVYNFDFKKENLTVYLIDSFHDKIGIYVLDDRIDQCKGRLIVIKQDIIQSMELYSTKYVKS